MRRLAALFDWLAGLFDEMGPLRYGLVVGLTCQSLAAEAILLR